MNLLGIDQRLLTHLAALDEAEFATRHDVRKSRRILIQIPRKELD